MVNRLPGIQWASLARQSVRQSVGQTGLSASQSVDQPGLSVWQSVDQPGLSASQSVTQPVGKLASQSENQSVSRPVILSVRYTVASQLVQLPASQPVSLSVVSLVSRSDSQLNDRLTLASTVDQKILFGWIQFTLKRLFFRLSILTFIENYILLTLCYANE